jgi:cyanate permease
VVAIIFKFWVVDWPETAKFLSDADRALLLRRLRSDAGFARMDHLDKRAAKRIFSDWKIYVGIMMYMGVVNTGYATSFFIPTIIEQLGFTAQASQLRSIPVFMVAAVLSLTTAWTADRVKHRYTFAMLGVAVATTGYVILLYQGSASTGVRYFACFLITGGGYMTQPVTWVWLSNVRISYHADRTCRR